MLTTFQFYAFGAVRITRVDADVEFKGVFTKNIIEITMQNDDKQDSLEFSCSFTANTSSFVKDMWLTIDKQYVRAETIPRQTATRIYERIVRRKIDPALLTTDGNGNYNFRVYPFRKNEERKIKLELFSMLDLVDKNYEYNLFLQQNSIDSLPINYRLNGEYPGKLINMLEDGKSYSIYDSIKISFNTRKILFLRFKAEAIDRITKTEGACTYDFLTDFKNKNDSFIYVNTNDTIFNSLTKIIKARKNEDSKQNIIYILNSLIYFSYYNTDFAKNFRFFLRKNKNLDLEFNKFNHTNKKGFKYWTAKDSSLYYKIFADSTIYTVISDFRIDRHNKNGRNFVEEIWQYFSDQILNIYNPIDYNYLTNMTAKLVIENDKRAMQIFDEEIAKNEQNQLPLDDNNEENIDCWVIPEQPVFIGGDLMLYHNLIYPKKAKEEKIDGKVTLKFECNRFGNPQSIIILLEKPQNWGFGEAAVAALRKCRFKPAHFGAYPTRVRMHLPVNFKIDKQTKLPEYNPYKTFENIENGLDYFEIPFDNKKFIFLSTEIHTSYLESVLDINHAQKIALFSDKMFELLYQKPDYIKYFLDIYDYHSTEKMINPIKKIGMIIDGKHYLFE